MNGPDIDVLVIQPDGSRVVSNVPQDLELFRQFVGGGYLTAVTLPDVTIFVDEDGRAKGLPVNISGTRLAHNCGWDGLRSGDFFVGPAIFVGKVTRGGWNKSVPAAVLAIAEEMPTA